MTKSQPATDLLTVNSDIDSKFEALARRLKQMQSVLVTFSGGTDSAFLLKVAVDCLGKSVLAVTAHSEIYKTTETEAAKDFAQRIGARHLVVKTRELSIEKFRLNPRDRCYYCKSHLFSIASEIQKEHGLNVILDGANYDDLSDYRPGMTAACEFEVHSPLQEVFLTKSEIRELSKRLELTTWDKPAQPCLSSRFTYGNELTDDKLRRVEKAEAFIAGLGVGQLRVRVDEDTARIETTPEGTKFLLEENINRKVVETLRRLGYKKVTVDPKGYRMGSMNEKRDRD